MYGSVNPLHLLSLRLFAFFLCAFSWYIGTKRERSTIFLEMSTPFFFWCHSSFNGYISTAQIHAHKGSWSSLQAFIFLNKTYRLFVVFGIDEIVWWCTLSLSFLSVTEKVSHKCKRTTRTQKHMQRYMQASVE